MDLTVRSRSTVRSTQVPGPGPWGERGPGRVPTAVSDVGTFPDDGVAYLFLGWERRIDAFFERQLI